MKDYIYAGETFYVTVHLENTSTDTRTVHTLLYCESIHYNGQRENLLKKKVITKTLEPDSGRFNLFILMYFPIHIDTLVGVTVA